MNTDALDWALMKAERRVLKIQTKLHQWAAEDQGRQFDDVLNLVCDPAFLLVAWARVRRNKGARTAGVDGRTVHYIEHRGVEVFLDGLRASMKSGEFRPLPVRERMIPKPGTSRHRRLGIPAVRDRVVQAALKLVLEPIWETDFLPCSYGFRPGRRAHDAVAEIRVFASPPHRYEWAVEGDITACFDEISHSALLERVRERITDKRVVKLIKAFLKAGILSEDRQFKDTAAGTPQGGILSPLLSNLALTVLDEHFAPPRQAPGVHGRGMRSVPHRLVRYADDWVLLVRGIRADAENKRDQAAAVLSSMGLRLSEEKTKIVHIDEGFDFLGWRIQRHRKRGTDRSYVYTYPSKKALKSAMGKVKQRCDRIDTNQPLAVLLLSLGSLLRGWTAYFRPGVSHRTFHYLSHYTWQCVTRWLRRKHLKSSWGYLKRRYCNGKWWPAEGGVVLFDPGAVPTTRYSYRGSKIPTPWPSA